MLERQSFQEPRLDDGGLSLTPAYIFEIAKRRAIYFLVPFLVIFGIGSLILIAWPSQYLSQGTILVQSQEIPTDLVRPTVAALANDRIEVIKQRIMTREKITALATKFGLSKSWQAQMAGTEFVDFIRDRTIIQPYDVNARDPSKPNQQVQSQQKKDAIAFSVGFSYESPQTAQRVANELLTMILSEDVRLRTEFATETARFIDEEVKRLEGQLRLNDQQISELRRSRIGTLTDTSQLDSEKELDKLRAELLLKSAIFSDSHPDIQALKRKIASLEKSAGSTNATGSQNAPTSANALGLDTLETKRKSLKDELDKATQKLTAARLGENLERGQHSQRLEVIEQPTLPEKSINPNKPKILAFIFVFALMVGGGLAVATEMLNQSIRRSTDLFSLVDSRLVVTIPYISTHSELVRKKRTIIIALGAVTAAVLAGLIVLLFILPPLDILFGKVMTVLFK
jgi:uncharacterized protein involved in exopolysaccharide biosynthesis